MTTEATTISQTNEEVFQTEQVLTISFGHMIHDSYTAFVPPLLPLIMEKLSLSLTMVGTLTAFLQLPAVLHPFIGYFADRISLRYFVILAPAITATLMSFVGLAPNYLILAIILTLTGISSSIFHAPAPAMIARISGAQVGKGMSFFMAAGELARTIGPLLAVWAVSNWALEGYYPILIIGWITSVLLFWRLRTIPGRPAKPIVWGKFSQTVKVLFLPLLGIVLSRVFLSVCLSTYLPTYMKLGGESLWVAGASLSILEFAGVGGALLSGTISDRFGRRPVLMVASIASALLTLVFLFIEGWLLVPVLLALGFSALSTGPVLLALVQDHLPENRAVGNGLYLLMSMLIRSFASLMIGVIGDAFGLQAAYTGSAFIALLAIPAIFALPKEKKVMA